MIYQNAAAFGRNGIGALMNEVVWVVILEEGLIIWRNERRSSSVKRNELVHP